MVISNNAKKVLPNVRSIMVQGLWYSGIGSQKKASCKTPGCKKFANWRKSIVDKRKKGISRKWVENPIEYVHRMPLQFAYVS